MNSKVNILMSTYNGIKYISSQMESILEQKSVNITVSVRDDGSLDDTSNKLIEMAKHNDNISCVFGQNLGYKSSFMDLVYNSAESYDFYAFSDQDDIWLENKIISAVEQIGNSSIPKLYFSNCLMVDNDLNELGLLHKVPLNIKRNLNYNIINGFAHGCTIVFNSAAMDLIKQYKLKYDCAHDYWIPLIISEFGELVYDFDPKILYRQHSNNVFGGQKITTFKLIQSKFRKFKSNKNFYSNVAKEILSGYKELLNSSQIEELNLLVDYKVSFRNKINLLLKKDVRRQSIRGTLYLKLLILINHF